MAGNVEVAVAAYIKVTGYLLFLASFLLVIAGGLPGVAGGNANESAVLRSCLAGWSFNPLDFITWSITADAPCQWRGVTCNGGSTHVLEVRLPGLLQGGAVDPRLARLPALQVLELPSNNLTGPIPPQLNSLANLSYLDLSSNRLINSIPLNLTGLRTLTLGNNSLNGSLPDTLGSLVGLRYLYLEGNAFTGSVPVALGLLRRLRELKLSFNDFSGQIPPQLGGLNNLRVLDLANNGFTGEIPASLGNLTLMTIFSLAYNNLTGPIPESPVLRNFSAGSYTGNPGLCGPPLNVSCSTWISFIPPSPSPSPSVPPPRSPLPMPLPSQLPSPPPVTVIFPSLLPPPVFPPQNRLGNTDTRNLKISLGVIFGILGFFLAGVCVYFAYPERRQRRSQSLESAPSKTVSFLEKQDYDYRQIVAHAGNFDKAHVLGKGRLATVYLSLLPDGTRLAVKVFQLARFNDRFDNEMVALGQVRHPFVLRMRGFHSGRGEKAIFSDYMPNGSLYEMLQHRMESLDWSTRLRIALKAAQGLEYLHCERRAVHKDVTSRNILLDNDMVPRVADFGLAGLVNIREVINPVIGTPGYTAPELLQSGKKFTMKSDIYAFGVVLLELITGRKPLSHVGDQRTVSLAFWARRLHKEKRGKDLYDPKVVESCLSREHLEKALSLAILCVDEEGYSRPTISEVASILETLTLQPTPPMSPQIINPKQSLLPSH